MSTIEKSNELEEAARFALTGKADPAILEHIMDECVRIEEDVRQRFGDRELSVELVREIRDEDE
jgi:hypothetical protein